jgi:hypothetical protein
MNTSSKAPTAASDGSRSAALSKPPWFTDDEQQLGIAYFRNQEFGFVRGEANRSCTQVYRGVSGGPLTHGRAQRCRTRPKVFSLPETAFARFAPVRRSSKI